MRIVVDRDRCIGAGQCVRVADELFDQSDDDGIVLLLKQTPAAESEEAAREAVQLCPSQAIWIGAEVGQS
jgi:ferredoxin